MSEGESLEEKTKKFFPHFRIPTLMVVILTQYLLTIASAIVSLMIWRIRDGESTLTSCALQILLTLSSNCCSVACTLSFLSREDEDKAFQPKRTIIIVISLVVNLILSLLLSSGLIVLSENQQSRLLIWLGSLTVFLVVWLTSIQRKVEGKNANRANQLSPLMKKTVDESKKLKTPSIDGEEMNFEESEDDNQST